MTPSGYTGQALVLGGASYNADIIAGALMVPESRVVADLLLSGITDADWRDAIRIKNVLKSRNRDIANRVSRLIRARLETMGPDLWRLVRDGTGSVASHAVLASAVKQSRLLGDFLALVVAEQYRLFGKSLSNKLWEDYLDGCRERDPALAPWQDLTRRRLRSSVFQTLAQAGYIENTRTLTLQAVHIADPVLRYLKAHSEEYVLRCIEVAP